MKGKNNMDRISAAKAAKRILIENGENASLDYLVDNTKKVDNGYIVSWQYAFKKRYHIDVVNEIRNKFQGQTNILIKPDRIYFYFDNTEKKLNREELTRLSGINFNYLYDFMVNEEEYEMIRERYIECIKKGNISKTKSNLGITSEFIKCSIVGGIDKLNNDENFRNELYKWVEIKKNDRKKPLRKNATAIDEDLIIAIDILYQNLNLMKKGGIISKCDIIRFITLYTDIDMIQNRKSIGDVSRRIVSFPVSEKEMIKRELINRKISFQRLVNLSVSKALHEYQNGEIIPKEVISESSNNMRKKDTTELKYFVSLTRDECKLFDDYVAYICRKGYPVSIEDTVRGMIYHYLNTEK